MKFGFQLPCVLRHVLPSFECLFVGFLCRFFLLCGFLLKTSFLDGVGFPPVPSPGCVFHLWLSRAFDNRWTSTLDARFLISSYGATKSSANPAVIESP